MSSNNGVIRIGRKGLKKFAIGEEGEPFEVDVVVAFQQWVGIDEQFRPEEEDADGLRPIPVLSMPEYHRAAVAFVTELSGNTTSPLTDALSAEHGVAKPTKITTAEALDFIARLREQYDELASFFRPRSREKPDLPATSGVEHRFSVEES